MTCVTGGAVRKASLGGVELGLTQRTVLYTVRQGEHRQFLSRRHKEAAKHLMRGQGCPSCRPVEGHPSLTLDAVAPHLPRSPETGGSEKGGGFKYKVMPLGMGGL